MRTGNELDGMYFLLLIIPFGLSFWAGDLLRNKIMSYLVLERSWSHSLSSFAGIFAEILVVLAGIITGYLLLVLI
jgi:uncharacterized membrane protein